MLAVIDRDVMPSPQAQELATDHAKRSCRRPLECLAAVKQSSCCYDQVVMVARSYHGQEVAKDTWA